MLTSTADSPKKTQQLKVRNKDYRFSTLLTKDVCMNNFSIEDYHGGVSVSIPFRWESEPGTPKMRFREKPLPPLTPPPSYCYNSPKCSIKKHPKSSNLLGTMFPKSAKRKSQLPSSPASLSSSSSASSSQSSSPWSTSHSMPSSLIRPSNFRGRYETTRPRLSFDDSRALEEEEHEYESPVSTLCFARVGNARSRNCYTSIIKVFLRNSR